MSLLSILFDVTSGNFVQSLNNSGVYRLPNIHQEDSLAIDLMKVKRISYTTPPYFSLESIANDALMIAVGTAGVVNASQNVWTKNSDNTVFSGVLALNTAGITALTEGATQIFEVRLFDGTNYYRGQQTVTYRQSVALAGTLQTPATDTALGKIEASEIYVPWEWPAGRGMTLVSADGLKKTLLYLANDGTPRWVNLT